MDVHFQALCNAVEHERADKCRSILRAAPHMNLRSANADGFTPLELAFMTGRQELVSMMLEAGGAEGEDGPSAEVAAARLGALIHESKRQVDKFGQLIKAARSSGHAAAAQLSHAQLRECEKQQTLWQKRAATLTRLKAGLEASGRPHVPARAEAAVIGSDRVCVRVRPPEQVSSRSLYTKCKVQWSTTDSFYHVDGERTGPETEIEVGGLREGRRYFFRASFGNPRGFGPFSATTPKSVVPSSWRSVEDRAHRITMEQLEVCERTFRELKGPHGGGSGGGGGGGGGGGSGESEEPQKSGKRKALRNFFTGSSAPKFQRSLAFGRIYLCCVLFHEDKVLMTNDEVLPVMEVDSEVPANLHTELVWLARLSFAWKDVDRLRQDATKLPGSSGPYAFRGKLLQTTLSMQQALGLTDLGSVFHRPFQHPGDGSVVMCTVAHVKNPKLSPPLSSLSLKWVPLGKAQRRVSFDGQVGAMDALRYSLREQILYQQVSEIHLGRGLYLCYLQTTSTVDAMSVLVSNTSPSVLPYVRVRENPHVTCDEWSWISKLGRLSSGDASSMEAPSPTTNFLAGEGEEGSEVRRREDEERNGSNLKPTEAQYSFGMQIRHGMDRLFSYLDIPQSTRGEHRLFDQEVFELSPEVSLVLVLPPPEMVCSVVDKNKAQTTDLASAGRNDLLALHLHLFESVHLSVYHPDTWVSFCRASLSVDLEAAVARQQQREAFSSKEVSETQRHLAKVAELQQKLEECWRPARWLHEVISLARAKQASSCGVMYTHLCDWYDRQTELPDDAERQLPIGGSAGNSDSMAAAAKISRTPTTRSDPLEFNLSSSNKENEVRNFPYAATSHQNHLSVSSPSSYNSLSQPSTNSSLSSSEQQPLPQYENMPAAAATTTEPRKKKSFEPRVAQQGRFIHAKNEAAPPTAPPEPNVLQVYAAYDTGLASGTSVKLNVTHSTSAREVIDLVVRQLNMAVILKGKDGPTYENERLKNFCLVAVIGSRERCLRDDFKPLNLQNPWKKGKLFVRMKNDLLAAIDHISRHSTML